MTEFKVGDRVEFMDGRTGTVTTVLAYSLQVCLDRSHQLIQSGQGGFKILKETKS